MKQNNECFQAKKNAYELLWKKNFESFLLFLPGNIRFFWSYNFWLFTIIYRMVPFYLIRKCDFRSYANKRELILCIYWIFLKLKQMVKEHVRDVFYFCPIR